MGDVRAVLLDPRHGPVKGLAWVASSSIDGRPMAEDFDLGRHELSHGGLGGDTCGFLAAV